MADGVVDSWDEVSGKETAIRTLLKAWGMPPDVMKIFDDSVVMLVMVAAIWGCTTPLLRHGSKGLENISKSSFIRQWLSEVYFLISNWKYVFPLLINLSGSAVYALSLSSADLSLAVPLTNSLTFIFVSITGRILGETDNKSVSYLGMTLVFAGVILCVLDRT